MIWLIVIIIYILSIVFAWYGTSKYYSKEEFSSVDGGDILIIFLPLYNVIFGLIYLLDSFDCNKFFKIKK